MDCVDSELERLRSENSRLIDEIDMAEEEGCVADDEIRRLTEENTRLRSAMRDALVILRHNPNASQPPRYRNIQASKIIDDAINAESRA